MNLAGEDHSRRAVRTKTIIVVVTALVMVALVIAHAPGINGPWYWKWEFRRHHAWPLYVVMALAASPILAAQWVHRASVRGRFVALLLVILGSLALRYASVYAQSRPASLNLIRTIIRDDYATSYYTDAIALSKFDGWFGAWDQILELPQLHLHTRTKPPGAVLFFATVIRVFGDTELATHIAAAMLGLLAVLALPATYLLIKQLIGDAEAGFCGASFMALCPGFALFFPMFDPTYALISCALIGFWGAAVRGARLMPAVAMGAALAVTCVVTFNVLVIGVFCALYPFLIRARPSVVIRQAAIALATATILLSALWLATGYNPVLTFRTAWINQHELLARHAESRPYPATILFDLTDFALGSGWISVPLVVFYFLNRSDETRRIVCVVLIQLGVVAVLGLLQAETARVWNFMLPLLMIPIGLELCRWPTTNRLIALLALLADTGAICQNLKFIF